jgi:hypothetical protein
MRSHPAPIEWCLPAVNATSKAGAEQTPKVASMIFRPCICNALDFCMHMATRSRWQIGVQSKDTPDQRSGQPQPDAPCSQLYISNLAHHLSLWISTQRAIQLKTISMPSSPTTGGISRTTTTSSTNTTSSNSSMGGKSQIIDDRYIDERKLRDHLNTQCPGQYRLDVSRGEPRAVTLGLSCCWVLITFLYLITAASGGENALWLRTFCSMVVES